MPTYLFELLASFFSLSLSFIDLLEFSPKSLSLSLSFSFSFSSSSSNNEICSEVFLSSTFIPKFFFDCKRNEENRREEESLMAWAETKKREREEREMAERAEREREYYQRLYYKDEY